MNFWSAKVWCQKHGGQLASYTSVCQLSMPGAASCPNISSFPNWSSFWLDDSAPTDGKNWWLYYGGDSRQMERSRSAGPSNVPIYALCE